MYKKNPRLNDSDRDSDLRAFLIIHVMAVRPNEGLNLYEYMLQYFKSIYKS
ncbi:MAG: hypothetical protein LCH67_16350 [Bacteroidetes bacterium]|nr:hypothetical protein [Bacteroidota bacterium]